MTTTTHPEFYAHTEALEVAQAFSEGIRGKTVVVTGVNRGGIGFTTSEAFASQSPAHLIIAGRNSTKLQESFAALKARFPEVEFHTLEIDLSSQRSVRHAAAELLSWANIPTIDILINSAGVGLVPERTLTEDGVEMHFATNHIGHFLFTCLIMPKLMEAAKSSPKGATRVINVTSLSPTIAKMRWHDINFNKNNLDLPLEEQPNYEMLKAWGAADPESKIYVPLEAYNQSKVANVLFSIAMTRRLYDDYGILSLSAHPGVILSEINRHAPPEAQATIETLGEAGLVVIKSLGAGAATSMVAALDPALKAAETKGGKENHGVYLLDCQISDQANPLAVSSSEAEKLWKLSEELVKETFTW